MASFTGQRCLGSRRCPGGTPGCLLRSSVGPGHRIFTDLVETATTRPAEPAGFFLIGEGGRNARGTRGPLAGIRADRCGTSLRLGERQGSDTVSAVAVPDVRGTGGKGPRGDRRAG